MTELLAHFIHSPLYTLVTSVVSAVYICSPESHKIKVVHCNHVQYVFLTFADVALHTIDILCKVSKHNVNVAWAINGLTWGF